MLHQTRCINGMQRADAISLALPTLVDGMQRADAISLALPTLVENDPLFIKKKNLLAAGNINTEFVLQLPYTSYSVEANQTLEEMIRAARILNMDADDRLTLMVLDILPRYNSPSLYLWTQTELYFVGDNNFGPFSNRNELEALNSVLSALNFMLPSATTDGKEVLQVLQDAIVEMIKSFGSKNGEEMVIDRRISDAEELLLQWGKDRGVKTKLQISYYDGAGRGVMATEDVSVGDVVLEIPEPIIISEDLVHETDMFHILKDTDGITPETMLLLWSMKERYNAASKFKIYFETLPKAFNTGLSFGIDALSVLEGTLLFEEIVRAKEHLRTEYEALCPPLCASYPDVFQPEIYTWEMFLWACELWYSNSMKVVFSDGKLRTCLVPIAGLLNHSLCPHILHYGKVDSITNSLKFPLSRPCKAGEQCYLSYGCFSSAHFVNFYGFLPKGDNPYDIIPLDIDTLQAEESSIQPTNNESDWASHMVRATWLSNNNDIYIYGLPSPLLSCLRAAINGGDTPTSPSEHDCNAITKDIEMAVLETILSIFNPMMEGLGEVEDLGSGESTSWDVKLALGYKDLQRKIIGSILASCSSGLQMFGHV